MTTLFFEHTPDCLLQEIKAKLELLNAINRAIATWHELDRDKNEMSVQGMDWEETVEEIEQGKVALLRAKFLVAKRLTRLTAKLADPMVEGGNYEIFD